MSVITALIHPRNPTTHNVSPYRWNAVKGYWQYWSTMTGVWRKSHLYHGKNERPQHVIRYRDTWAEPEAQ